MTKTPFRHYILRASLILLALLVAGAASAQELTLPQIMADPDWLGRSPERPFWSEDGATIYYYQKAEGSPERLLQRVDRAGNDLGQVSDQESGTLSDAPNGTYSADWTEKLFERHGDIFLRDLESDLVRQLTRTQARESSPLFAGDDRVAYTRDGQVYVRDLKTGLESQPFPHARGDDPEESRRKKRKKPDYLRDQQTRLIEWIRLQEERRTRRITRAEERQEADSTRSPKLVYLGKGENVRRQVLSPRGDALLLVTNRGSRKDNPAAKMPRYVTDSGFTEVDDVRPKVGGKQTSDSLVLLHEGLEDPLKIDLSSLPRILEDPLADLRKAADERRKAAAAKTDKESEKKKDQEKKDTSKESEETESKDEKVESQGKKKPKPRGVRTRTIEWSPQGDRAVVELVSIDNKDRWIALLDLKGDLTLVHHVTDEAWTNWRFGDVSWLPQGNGLYFLSETSGYSQLYRASLDSAEPAVAALTEGDFVVNEVQLSRDGRHIYFTANPEHPGHYDVFRVPTGPGPHSLQRLTETGGLTSFRLSPKEDALVLLHSEATAPPELYLQPASESSRGAALRLTQTVSDAFSRIPWIEPESVQVPSSHVDRPIFGRLYRPANAPAEPAPVVVFAHGAGYLQNAHLGWSGYFREFMFHSLLVQEGYVVLDLDFRASAGYGRDWRTAIYRQMGTPEVEDLRDGVEWLAANHNIDPERVGIYGGSYGGFLTFMAMFRDPELFAAGAALRPVTDWAHYNHRYTANILNTPEVDPEAYEKSSPIEFAEGLEKPLLIASGMLDDNVHFQDSVRLVQKLIELGKEDWEMAIYPVERHGFVEPSSWLDEYRRIFKLFEDHLK